MHALNKLISIEISFIKLTCNALFEILNASDVLLTFIHWIIYLISSYDKTESNNTVSNINNLKVSLMFI